MFAFANMFHFFADEFARLSGRRLAFALVFASPFDGFFFRHSDIVSPLTPRLDVTKTVKTSASRFQMSEPDLRGYTRPNVQQTKSLRFRDKPG